MIESADVEMGADEFTVYRTNNRPPWLKMCARCHKIGDHRWPLKRVADYLTQRDLPIPCASCIGEIDAKIGSEMRGH